jgi:hypothetical protein
MSAELRTPPQSATEKPRTIGLESGTVTTLLRTRDVLFEYKKNHKRKEKIDPRAIVMPDEEAASLPYQDAALTRSDQMKLVRKVRKLVKRTVAKPERSQVLLEVGVTPELAKESRKTLIKENAKTTVVTVASEGVSFAAGLAAAKSPLPDYMPGQHPWVDVVSGVAVVSYAGVWKALQVYRKANDELLAATGVSTDPFSKTGHEFGTKDKAQKLGSKVGYWIWHSGWEVGYAGSTVATYVASGQRTAAAFALLSNAVGTGVILEKARRARNAASKEREKQGLTPETSVQAAPIPTTVFEK